MIGSLLALFEAMFDETASSLGKKSIAKKEESPYAFLFITYLIAVFVFLVVGLSADLPYHFNFAAIPTFTSRLIFEMILGYVMLKSLTLFDRSFFSLSRMMTVPLVLLLDMSFGTQVPFFQILIIALMFLTFLLLCLHEKVSFKRLRLALPLAVIPAITILLFKYDISHYNSAYSEQLTILVFMMLWSFCMDIVLTKENPFRLLSHPIILAQATCSGVASLAGAYAYNYGSASVVTALRRSFSLLASFLSDIFFFKRKERKDTIVTIIVLLVLLALLTMFL